MSAKNILCNKQLAVTSYNEFNKMSITMNTLFIKCNDDGLFLGFHLTVIFRAVLLVAQEMVLLQNFRRSSLTIISHHWRCNQRRIPKHFERHHQVQWRLLIIYTWIFFYYLTRERIGSFFIFHFTYSYSRYNIW